MYIQCTYICNHVALQEKPAERKNKTKKERRKKSSEYETNKLTKRLTCVMHV